MLMDVDTKPVISVTLSPEEERYTQSKKIVYDGGYTKYFFRIRPTLFDPWGAWSEM